MYLVLYKFQHADRVQLGNGPSLGLCDARPLATGGALGAAATLCSPDGW